MSPARAGLITVVLALAAALPAQAAGGGGASARRGSAIRSSRSPATAATTSGTTAWRSTTRPRRASSTRRRSSAPAPRSRSRASIWTCAASTSPGCWSTAARRLPARRPGADRHAAAGAAAGRRLHRARALRRRARGDHRPRRLDRGLGADRRRRLRRRRAAGRAGLVPGQRQPAGQGDLRHGHHGARRPHRAGQRRPRRALLAWRAHDLGVARGRPDGDLPGDRDQRPLRR